MARSTIAIALLGLLACAAVAQADNAETQKRHHGGYDKHRDDYKEERHDDRKRSLSFTLGTPVYGYQGRPEAGATFFLTVDLLDPKDTTGTKVLANARLTGIATSVTAPDFTLNADLSIVVSDGRYKGTILTASGPVAWDNAKKAISPLSTMVVTGASGLLEGADGTVVLANNAPAPTMTFNLRLRDGDDHEGKHGKDY